MKMENRPNGILRDDYYCDLTRELDTLAKLDGSEFFKHYIFIDAMDKSSEWLAIRVPGGTVGSIRVDANNTILKIEIDTKYVIKTYPDNVNEIIQKYIGEVLEV